VELPPSGCADLALGDDVLRVGKLAGAIVVTPLRGTLVSEHEQESIPARMIVLGIEGTISEPGSLRWQVTVLPDDPAAEPRVFRA
jgi:hypothetical protein